MREAGLSTPASWKIWQLSRSNNLVYSNKQRRIILLVGWFFFVSKSEMWPNITHWTYKWDFLSVKDSHHSKQGLPYLVRLSSLSWKYPTVTDKQARRENSNQWQLHQTHHRPFYLYNYFRQQNKNLLVFWQPPAARGSSVRVVFCEHFISHLVFPFRAI